jgi:hypothetical protein
VTTTEQAGDTRFICWRPEDVSSEGDREGRQSSHGWRLCCFVAAPDVHPAKARRIAANIAKLPGLLR